MMRLQTPFSIVVTLVASMASSWLSTRSAAAQQAGADKANQTTATSAEMAKKQAIFSSQAWLDLKAEFHQWLSAQVVMTPQQVEQMKMKLDAEVKTMSAAELQQFVDQWNAKLQVLLGKDGVETREWLAQNLMVMADGYRKQFLQELGITDVTNMTAAQIEQKILEIRAKRNSIRGQRAFFDLTRQKEVEYAHQTHAEWRAEAQQAAKDSGMAPKFDTFQSQYSPVARDNYSPQRYRPAYGGPLGGYGWGGIFW